MLTVGDSNSTSALALEEEDEEAVGSLGGGKMSTCIADRTR